MFNYFLSVAVAFIVFSFIFNILKRIYAEQISKKFDQDEMVLLWVFVAILAAAWFFTVPVLFVILIVFLLKMLTDKIADVTFNYVKKRKLKKQSKIGDLK